LRTISLFTKGATQNNEGDANSQNKSQIQQTSHPGHARKLLEETRPINIRNLHISTPGSPEYEFERNSR
jgi:hypothetical protein